MSQMLMIHPHKGFIFEACRREPKHSDSWSMEAIITFVAEKLDVPTDAVSEHLLRHIGPEATHRHKTYIINAIGHILNLAKETSTNEQLSLCLKLQEGFKKCTEGLIIRLNDITRSFNRPRNMTQFLTVFREDLMRFIAHKLTDEVHIYNAFTLYAATRNLGVEALHPGDVFLDNQYFELTSKQKTKFEKEFNTGFNSWALLDGLVQAFSRELQDYFEYKGYNAEGYVMYQYDAIVAWFKTIFLPEELSVNDIFLVDKETSCVQALNWPVLIAQLMAYLVAHDYLQADAGEALFFKELVLVKPHIKAVAQLMQKPYYLEHVVELIKHADLLKQYSPLLVEIMVNHGVRHTPFCALNAFEVLQILRPDAKPNPITYHWMTRLPFKIKTRLLGQALSSTSTLAQSAASHIATSLLRLNRKKRSFFLTKAQLKEDILTLAARYQPEIIARLLENIAADEKIMLMTQPMFPQNAFEEWLQYHPIHATAFLHTFYPHQQLKLLSSNQGQSGEVLLNIMNYYTTPALVLDLITDLNSDQYLAMLTQQLAQNNDNLLTLSIQNHPELLEAILAKVEPAHRFDLYAQENALGLNVLMIAASSANFFDSLCLLLDSLEHGMQQTLIYRNNLFEQTAYSIAMTANNRRALDEFERRLNYRQLLQKRRPTTTQNTPAKRTCHTSFFQSSHTPPLSPADEDTNRPQL